MIDIVEAIALALLMLENVGDLSEGAARHALGATGHDGDCTDQCYTCMKCYADEHRAIARAALTAALDHMREPSNMVAFQGAEKWRAAGVQKLHEIEESDKPVYRAEACALIWQAMLDQLRKEALP